MIECEYIEEKNKYRLLKPLVWDIGFKGNPNKETVPTGYEFDVSIPWILSWLFNRHNPRYFKAAALHDYMLDIGYDKVSAAGAFNHGLKSTQVPYITRFIMTLAVAVYRFK
jgi:hypothetical protein